MFQTITSALFFFSLTAQANSFQGDVSHSKVGFEISHLVISTVEGAFHDFKVDYLFDVKAPEKSSVTAEIQVASINTGNDKRDEHLRNADFFEVSKFPKMTFKSKKVEKISDKKFKITGDLSLKGVTKEVVLDTDYLGEVKDAQGKQRTAFKAKTVINRKDYGLTWSRAVEAGPVVGDEVTVLLSIQGVSAQ